MFPPPLPARLAQVGQNGLMLHARMRSSEVVRQCFPEKFIYFLGKALLSSTKDAQNRQEYSHGDVTENSQRRPGPE